ncbi:MAG: DUF134 domain-containing protein [Candidatus Heimdallarchaeota archaeon]
MRPYRRRQGRGQGRGGYEGGEAPRGRPLKEIRIDDFPKVTEINPNPKQSDEIIHLTVGEYEAMRLVDQNSFNQDEAGQAMNVSRGTIWRLLDTGRAKMIRVIVEGKKLVVEKMGEKIE